MAATAILFRPNVTALRLVSSRACALSFMRRTASIRTATKSYSSGRSLFAGRVPVSGFPCSLRRTFCIRATADSENPASIGSPLMESMEKKIKEHLSAETVVVKDAYGDGRHVSIEVVSSAFEGQSAVNRQRMVYKAIWEELQDTVHAVDQMTTRTPSEAALGK
ncbi:protein BOLA4, chloroplastic/mitochondrial [Sesamum indicum]|uniref:Protein BOLA4, chloroplastic/mitochondrial n=1 Tax=Sesamum indicum TaxID=4182 RepID=A0A6I9TK90_SESIN|nr:protein BOLA4, chloroplastic/mitochondrial [Sesamum indicum]